MSKFKVKWREYVVNYYSAEIEAKSKNQAYTIISRDINGARTNVTEEDHSEVEDWYIDSVEKLHNETPE